MGIKEFFKKLKELWHIPKFKGIIQLVFWVIFFLIISLMFRSKDNNIEDIQIENSINSYEYNYKYQDNDNTINISGTYYKDKQVFYMNDVKYYSLNDKYYLANTNEEVIMSYATLEWEYESIEKIMDDNLYSNKIEYEDFTSYEYNILSSAYNKYYNTNYPNDIIITVLKKDKISEASINYGFGKVEITYTNINKIKNLDINID